MRLKPELSQGMACLSSATLSRLVREPDAGTDVTGIAWKVSWHSTGGLTMKERIELSAGLSTMVESNGLAFCSGAKSKHLGRAAW